VHCYFLLTQIADKSYEYINDCGDSELLSLDIDKSKLLIKDSISPIPLHKSLILLSEIERLQNPFMEHYLLAFAASTVKNASNLNFGPEVGVSKKKKNDVDVISFWLNQIYIMTNDLSTVNKMVSGNCKVFKTDARKQILDFIEPKSIDAVFTSPPYPNEKDYTRATRLESVLLGFVKDKNDLRNLKKDILRSNTRNVYKGDSDDDYIAKFNEIIELAKEVENKRISLGKTSGFEKLYHKVIKLYFGGMARHLENLKPVLKKNALLGYVVGDQASFLQVFIPTGKILGDIATELGYELVKTDVFRTRFATSTKQNLSEEVVILKWKG